MNANRFRQECNFGEVTLFIIHVLPHDSGVYSCRAYNLQGEATTSATVKVAGYEALLLNTQHPESWDRIQELERPRIVEEIEIPEIKEKPRFLTQLESFDNVAEGTPIRLEATFEPTRDNELTINWDFNGQSLGASQVLNLFIFYNFNKNKGYFFIISYPMLPLKLFISVFSSFSNQI